MNITESDRARFLKNIVIDGDCLKWVGAHNDSGYGIFTILRKNIRAHRFSFLATGKDIPNGLFVLHKCDVRDCVNPAHLFLGTKKDNAQDAISKGRFPLCNLTGKTSHFGEAHTSAKLTSDKVRMMRSMHFIGIGFYRLGKQFGVSKVAAKDAVLRRTWKHVE